MQGLYLIHHHPFMLFIGVLLGMLSSFSFLGPPKMVSVPTVLKDAVTVPVQDNQHSRKGAIIRETLYIAVITSSSLKNAQFIHDTWGQDASFIEYYVGNRTTLTDLPVVQLPNDRPLLFELLLYLHQEYNDDFNWFIIANENMYVRVQKLNKLLNQLDPTTEMYLGLPGQISWYKQAFFYELFCKISTGIILSRELLRKIVPHFEHCLHSTWLDESPDILLGKCIAQHISIQCSSSKEISQYFYDDSNNEKTLSASSEEKLKSIISAHPFQTKEEMYTIHKMYLKIDIKEIKKEKASLLKQYKAFRNVGSR